MERSKNGLDLISRASQNLKGKRSKGFLASLIYVTLIVSFVAIPYAGFAVSVLMFGYLTPGYINYMQKLIKGEDAKYVDLFKGKGDIVASLFLGIILTACAFVGGVLLIIPGFIFLAYFSMSFFFLNEDEISNVFGSMKNCAKNMKGNKTAMAGYKLIYYLYYLIVTLFVGCIAFFIYYLLGTSAWAIVIYVVLSIGFILLVSLNTMYFYSANIIFYDEVIDYHKEKDDLKPVAKKAKAEKTEVKAEEPAKAELVKEEAKVEEKKPAAKKTTTTKTTKPAANKTAAKPATKTETKKAAPKNVENKK